MSLVPIVCNILAKLFEPTQASVQMKVQGWYFPFQVIQVCFNILSQIHARKRLELP